MYIDKRLVKDFLLNWLKFLAIIAGFVGALAFMVWTMILGDQFFGNVGWVAVMIMWLSLIHI